MKLTNLQENDKIKTADLQKMNKMKLTNLQKMGKTDMQNDDRILIKLRKQQICRIL